MSDVEKKLRLRLFGRAMKDLAVDNRITENVGMRKKEVEALLASRRQAAPRRTWESGEVSNVRVGGRLKGDVGKGNGVAVGKRLGVQPTLARRVPAAGRNGKRLTTGERANVNAIIGKAAPGTNGLGHMVPQHVGASIKPQVPEQMGNALKPAGGSKKNPAQAGGARMARQNGGQRPTTFGKRRYDPEDERRHRQGALAATTALGGLELGRRGVREIQYDTRVQRGAPAALRPGPPPERKTGGWRDSKGKLRQANAEERIGEDMAYDIERKRHSAKVDAWGRLAKPKGVQVTARSGGKLTAGLALVGAGATLQSRRREPRWD